MVDLMTTDVVRAVVEDTAEARLKCLRLTLSKNNPDTTELDTLATTLRSFVPSFEGRLVVTVDFDGPPVNTSRETIVAVAALLMTADPTNVRKVKGVVVRPRVMTSNESALASLFHTLYVSRCPFKITSSTATRDAFVERLVQRERTKRLRREKGP